jgi:hypothetical protein
VGYDLPHPPDLFEKGTTMNTRLVDEQDGDSGQSGDDHSHSKFFKTASLLSLLSPGGGFITFVTSVR